MKSVRYLVMVVVALTVLCIASYLVAAPYAITPFFSPVLMLAIPLGLGIYLFRRLHADWRIYGFGILTFIVSQFLNLVFTNWTLAPVLDNLGLGPENPAGSLQLALYAVLLGLSSAVFVETARYVVYSRWLDKARSWKDGLMFGAGHGGVEAIIAGVIALAVFLVAFSLRNRALGGNPADQIQDIQLFLATYWNHPWHFYLLALIERISAIIFHLGAALLVLQAFTRRNISWYLAAILMHTLFTAIIVFATLTWGIYMAEAVLLLFAIFSLRIIFALRTDDVDAPSDEILEGRSHD